MSPPRILIVEDDAVQAEALCRSISEMQYEIAGLAATGDEAVARTLESRPSVVLMDIRLRGEMNGIQAAEEIHKRMDVPVIYQTAYSDEALVGQAKLTDPYAYLAKPVRDHELRACIEIALHKGEADRQIKHLSGVLRVIRQVNQLITRETDRERLLKKACERIVQARDYCCAWLCEAHDPQVCLGPTAWASHGVAFADYPSSVEDAQPVGLCPCTRALGTQGATVFRDIANDPVFDPWRETTNKVGLIAAVAVPIIHEGRLYGAMGVGADQPVRFEAEEVELLQEVADDLAYALHGIELDERRRQAEQALSQSEARYRRIAEAITDYIYTVQVEAGNAAETRHGPGCVSVTGYMAEEFAADPFLWLHMIVPEDQPRIEAQVRAVLAGQPACSEEHRIIRKDGQYRWVRSTLVPRQDERGRLLSYDGLIQDITERKHAEEALKAANERTNTILESISDAFFAMDRNMVITYYNQAAERLLGRSRREDVIGRRLFDAFPEGRGSVFEENYRKVIETGQPMAFETYFDVPPFVNWYDVRVYPSREGISVFFQVTTERKQAEEERLELSRRLLHSQKLESMGILAGGIAHDFNNLLMAILGNLDLARINVAAGKAARSSIDQAINATQRANDLTRQLLAYSGRGRFEIANLDLSESVKANAELFRAAIARTVMLNVELSPQQVFIQADPSQVQQVIMNLITNASEAIGDKPGVITLSTGMVEGDEEYLSRSRLSGKPLPGRFAYLEVSDTGCGMDEHAQQRLFEPFFTTKFTGRGLGMSAVLGIVRGHEGAILIDSAVGRGTVMRVLFPVSETMAESAEEAADATLLESLSDKRAKAGSILVVDDETAVRKLCQNYVEELGFRSIGAGDGQEALDLFRKHADDIACVLLDLTMPKLDGVSTRREMHRLRPDIPVILTSGYDQQESIPDCSGGVTEFLQKPYRLETLQSKLARLIGSASAECSGR